MAVRLRTGGPHGWGAGCRRDYMESEGVGLVVASDAVWLASSCLAEGISHVPLNTAPFQIVRRGVRIVPVT
jgi:hypothetical protein